MTRRPTPMARDFATLVTLAREVIYQQGHYERHQAAGRDDEFRAGQYAPGIVAVMQRVAARMDRRWKRARDADAAKAGRL